MGPGAFRLALVHDARTFDGHYGIFVNTREALAGTPIAVTTYTCYDPSLADEYPNDGVRIRGWRVPLGGYGERGFNRFFPIFTRQLRAVPADLVHISDVFLASLLRYRSDVVVSVADLSKLTTRYFPRSSSALHNRMLRYLPRAPALLTLTEWTRQEVAEHLHLDAGRIFVESPFSRLPPRGEPDLPPVAPPTEERPWNLLYVAVDRPGKNLPFFLDVLAGTDRRFRGTLVTAPTDATRALVHRLGLDGRITFRTGVRDLTAEYRSAQVLLFPSFYEGFGLPLVEAMSQGVPVLASDRTCIPEVVGGGGVVLPLEDPRPWVEALEGLTDPGRYRAAALRALARARTFSPERMRAGLLAAYECARRR